MAAVNSLLRSDLLITHCNHPRSSRLSPIFPVFSGPAAILWRRCKETRTHHRTSLWSGKDRRGLFQVPQQDRAGGCSGSTAGLLPPAKATMDKPFRAEKVCRVARGGATVPGVARVKKYSSDPTPRPALRSRRALRGPCSLPSRDRRS